MFVVIFEQYWVTPSCLERIPGSLFKYSVYFPSYYMLRHFEKNISSCTSPRTIQEQGFCFSQTSNHIIYCISFWSFIGSSLCQVSGPMKCVIYNSQCWPWMLSISVHARIPSPQMKAGDPPVSWALALNSLPPPLFEMYLLHLYTIWKFGEFPTPNWEMASLNHIPSKFLPLHKPHCSQVLSSKSPGIFQNQI